MTPAEIGIYTSLFASVAEEMGVVLRRSSYSPNIKERRDYSCGLFDAETNLIAQAAHIPVHLGSMPHSVKEVAEKQTLKPGDTIILNDPFAGGTHLPDITLVQALFGSSGTKPIGYLACRAHHSDVGGMTPGSMPLSNEIFQEGLIIPAVFFTRNGQVEETVLDLILANVRTPDERRGDLLAQLAALNRGKLRYAELLERYTESKVVSAKQSLLDYSADIFTGEISKWPPGVYAYQDQIELPGNQTAVIDLELTISKNSLTFDFSNSSPQVDSNANAVFPITESAVFYCLLGLIVMPANSGSLRHVTIKTKPQTIVDAKKPAPVAAGNVETSQRLVDVILGAFGVAQIPGIPAASQGTMNNLSFGGYQDNVAFAYYETIPGGSGALADQNGQSAVQCHMTNTRNTPIEVIENELPVYVFQSNIRLNSGGSGHQKGGDGIVREFEFLTETTASILSTRRQTVPYGIAGGKPGAAGQNFLRRAGTDKWQLLDGGYANLNLKPGDRLRIATPGGGGYGSDI